MTVQEMYKKTKAWMFEKASSKIYDDSILEITNKVLAEVYEENNMLRMFKGMAPFMDGIRYHQVSSMDDEIDYEDEYQYEVIPKGIDANLLMDDDLTKMSIYQTEYNNARVAHQVIVSQDVINEYI